MEDRDEAMWAGLGSIDAFIASSATSPRATPSRATSPADSPWSWDRLPPPRVMQVRLHDGEPADAAAELDLLLPSLPALPVASGRVEKPVPHALAPEPSTLVAAPKAEPQQVLFAKPEPRVPSPVPRPPSLLSTSATSSSTTPRPATVKPQQHLLPQMHHSPVRVQGAPTLVHTPPRKALQADLSAVNVSVPLPHGADGACTLKEKREREAKQFPKEVLGNLDGTTSAEVRKMNATERELVLYKRKLRNRESARRSRQKRQATLAELQEEIDDLMQITGRMVEAGISLHEENMRLRERLGVAHAEIKGLRSVYPRPAEVAGPANAASVALKMKLGG